MLHPNKQSTVQYIAGFALILVVMLASNSQASTLSERLIIGTQQDISAQMAEAVLLEAFKRCNQQVKFKYTPHRRALVMANNGEIDGDLMRVKDVVHTYPNLVQVPAPVYYLKMFAFTKRKLPILNRESLKGLRIGIERGVLLSEQITEGMNPQTFDSHERMIRMLKRNRLDVVIISEISGEKSVREAGLGGIITTIGPPLASKPLFLHLHKRHAQLVPQLANVLKEMEQSGEADAIRQSCIRKN